MTTDEFVACLLAYVDDNIDSLGHQQATNLAAEIRRLLALLDRK